MRVVSLHNPSSASRIAGALQTTLLLGLMMLLGGLVGRVILGGGGFAVIAGIVSQPLKPMKTRTGLAFRKVKMIILASPRKKTRHPAGIPT